MKPIKRFVLRLSETDHAKLAEWAEREHRSLHGHLLWIVDQAIQTHLQHERAELDAITNHELNDGPPNSIIRPR